jgi:hypothetical protein
MPPLQHWMRHTIGQAHRRLHHLKYPSDFDVRADSLGTKAQ